MVAVATECHIQFSFRFQPKLRLDFGGGEITSEAGLVLLREFDERLKLTAGLKGLVADERDRRYIEHSTLNPLRQRIYQIRGLRFCAGHPAIRNSAVRRCCNAKARLRGELSAGVHKSQKISLCYATLPVRR